MKQYLFILVIGFILQLLITPVVKWLALKLNFVDNPAARKLHTKPIPLLGGVGIISTFFILLHFFYKAATDLNLKAVIVGGVLIALVGLIDDKYGMRWLHKLIFQIIIVALVIFVFGIHTTILDNYFLDVCLTLFWVVGLTNSLNLMDNMDGLSAGTAAIASFFFSLLAFGQGQTDLAVFSFCLFVACLGFLKFNFSPAQIFMGDLGSMFLGLSLGFIAVLFQGVSFENWDLANYLPNGQYTLMSALIPILVLSVPLFDTLLVIILRPLNGIKISTPGKDHSSHRLTHLKSPLQKIIDKIIIKYLKISHPTHKKENCSPNKAIAQTRSVLVIYIIEIFMGMTALSITQLSLWEILIVLFFVIMVFLRLAQKLAMMKVY